MKNLSFLSLALLGFFPCLSLGQQVTLSSLVDDARPNAPEVIAKSTASTTPAWKAFFDRYITLNEMDFSLRYRSVFDNNNAHEFNQAQQRSVLDGRFKFDQEGRYAIAFRASTGKYFNWAYADFMGGGNKQGYVLEEQKALPAQTANIGLAYEFDGANVVKSYPSGGWAFNVRELYADVKPVKGIEFEYGSMDIDRGVASEITTYDYDGYISGERLQLKRPQNLFFDEASVTYAYLGDIYTPNFFERGQRLAHANYHQFLLRKRPSKRVDASFDYTWQDKANILHEDALVHIPESRVVDSVRIETYQRLNLIFFPGVPISRAGGNGYAITAEKVVNSRFSIEGGVDSVDPASVVLTQVGIAAIFGLGVNGDSYGIGQRFFVRPKIKITPYVDLVSYYTHCFDTPLDPAHIIWNKQALNAGFVFDFKRAFFDKKPTH